jgi:hypothetical protein
MFHFSLLFFSLSYAKPIDREFILVGAHSRYQATPKSSAAEEAMMRTADEQRDEEEEWEDKVNEDVRWDQENACVRLGGKSVLYNFRDVAACTSK